MLPPQSLGRSLERQQILRVAYAATGATFQCVVRATPAEITVIGLLPMGPRAFSLTWDGVQLKAESAVNDQAAPRPEQMLADLELAFWPLAALQSAAGTQWSVSEPQPGVRRIVHRGRLYAEVRRDGGGDPWDGHSWLVNFAQGYSLDIDSRPQEN